MVKNRVYDTPSTVEPDCGEVIVDGPDGIAISLTPEAAAQTAARLMEAAAAAKGQEELERDRKRRSID